MAYKKGRVLKNSQPSPQTKRQEAFEDAPSGLPELPDAVLRAQAHHYELARRATSQREKKSEFFDMMTYTKDYEKNRQYANTFLRAKKNDSEIRVNAGTLEKKIDLLVNEILSLNLEAEVRAFDQNNRRYLELGNDLTELIRITNIQERDQDLMAAAIRELIVQRAVFVQETFADYSLNGVRIQRPEKVLYSGLKVFVGDINLPMHQWNKQPYIIRYNRGTYALGEAIFKKKYPEMWQYVKPGSGGQGWMNGAFDARIYSLDRDEIEWWEFLSTVDNEYQLYVQAVPMESSGRKLSSELWDFPSYDMAVSAAKDMGPDWFYGRGVSAAGKVLAALSDEMIRSLLRKTWQSIDPPSGIKKPFDPADPSANKIYSKDVYDPGKFTQGVGKDDIQKLIDHQGPTQSEMEMTDRLNNLLQEQVGVPNQLQGQQANKGMTATEFTQLQQQGLKQIGPILIAAMRLVRELGYLRLYNILTNYTDIVSRTLDPASNEIQDVYRHFVIDDTMLENGRRGRKEIFLNDRPITDDEQSAIYEYENEQEKKGDYVRIHAIDIKAMQKVGMQFYIVAAPKEKEGSAMDKAYLSDALNQASAISNLTGRRINADKAIESFENVWRKKDWFEEPDMQSTMGAMPGQPGAAPGALPSPTEGMGIPPANVPMTPNATAPSYGA